MKPKSKIIRELLKKIGSFTGCSIQYNHMPCNTCFHTVWEDEGLSENMTHLFWITVLGMRGDYKEKDLVEPLKELIKDMEKVK